MPRIHSSSFRIGKVQAYRRGRMWYLCYHENGRRCRPRVGPDLDAARRLAAHTNAQLESGAITVLNFEPISLADLRSRWLSHHEQVRRSSVSTINRYRTASDHLMTFLKDKHPVRLASQFGPRDAEAFVEYLRKLEVSPNGHRATRKRRLMDKGLCYILETCRSLFSYAANRRHLSPYAPNPFCEINIDRIPIENAKPVILFTPEQERQFLEAADDWQFPLFLTLMLTGIRPGELTHLLLPQDLDLEAMLLRIHNKPQLSWQVKTRNERQIPLTAELVTVLRYSIGSRTAGPVFRRHHFDAQASKLKNATAEQMADEINLCVAKRELELKRPLERPERMALARQAWIDVGALREERVRIHFIRLACRIGLTWATSPKMLRHLFATWLQDTNVDPLIRNQLMGHSPAMARGAGGGLGMTGVYTHSKPETVRAQLSKALEARVATQVAREWIIAKGLALNSA